MDAAVAETSKAVEIGEVVLRVGQPRGGVMIERRMV